MYVLEGQNFTESDYNCIMGFCRFTKLQKVKLLSNIASLRIFFTPVKQYKNHQLDTRNSYPLAFQQKNAQIRFALSLKRLLA